MAEVKMTDDGITYCPACIGMLFCDGCGDMPDRCPWCGDDLDYAIVNEVDAVLGGTHDE